MLEIISATSIGLGIFLLGMKFLTEGLDRIASSRFKYMLINLQIHPLLGVFIGFMITGILQSSSATTVMIVSLVQANMLTLHQAASLIMGANIGTTLTSQLIAFDIGNYAFIPFLMGLVINLTSKNKKAYFVGNIFMGFSLIFIGMDLLTKGLSPLAGILNFKQILNEFGKNPILGILLGFSAVSILQSSSAGVAILQSLALNNSISLHAAVSIMLGMNIGTCITALLASLNLSKAAKQAAFIHILFNTLGVVLIFPFIHLLCKLSIFLSPMNPSRQIAHANTLFNALNTLIFLPFIDVLVNMVQFSTKKTS